MEEHGGGVGPLQPRGAKEWFALWQRQQEAARATRLPRRHLGTGVRRAAAGRVVASGKRAIPVFRKHQRRAACLAAASC
eukprot:5887450-Lingulodinium_polyedra.AAC.1